MNSQEDSKKAFYFKPLDVMFDLIASKEKSPPSAGARSGLREQQLFSGVS
ncbi:hypothetical protein PULV_a3701 [Pseudoalteromonas ulvae UL12]|nr:hypothetical protein [Pseudoalteromonas ulvae UL12]